MPAWIVISETDLNNFLVAAQAEAIRSAALAEDQPDRFSPVMQTVATRIRSEVQAGKWTVSATAFSVPPELKQQACLIIIEAMQSGIPGLDMSEDQVRLCNDARDYLKRIAKGEIAVTMPDDPIATPTVQSGGSVEVVNRPKPYFTNESLKGLL